MKGMYFYIKGFRWLFSISILAMFISIALDMVTPQLLRVLIDDVIIDGQMHLFAWALLGIAIITLSRSLLGYTKEYLCDYGSQKVIEKLRHHLFVHLQSLSFAFYDGMNTGELMSRMKEDVDAIWRALSFGILLFIEQCLYFIIAATVLFFIHWQLALVAMAIMPLIALIAIRLEREIGQVFSRISDQGVKITTTAQENLVGALLVKAFAREKHEIGKFLQENQMNYHLKMEQAAIWKKYFPAVEFLTNVVIVMVTTAGGYLVIRDDLSIGNLVAFSNYLMMLVWPMRMLGWLINILAECRAAMKKLHKLFQARPDIKEAKRPEMPDTVAGQVEFNNVSFSHKGVPILRDINLKARPGSTIALMGVTGAGKSSLINLLPRYYDSTQGEISIDGVDVQNWPLQTLREHISVVMQETFLFSDTIEANVRLGNPQASPQEVERVLEDAAIAPFIRSLPKGIKTEIGERGIGLSGGQKQRLAIARALLKNSPILILDDATSNLDMETEYRIQKTLKRKTNITKFIIAHRISAVKDAHEILIMEDGQIVERGTHAELMALQQRYYRIFCQQYHELTG